MAQWLTATAHRQMHMCEYTYMDVSLFFFFLSQNDSVCVFMSSIPLGIILLLDVF